MLFRPAIIALLLASAASVAMVVGTLPFAWDVLRNWNIASGSERQLRLERRTYLISVLLGFVLVTQLAALLLFVFNAGRMAPLFVGAMCAAGTLNVNAYGYPALMARMAAFFCAAVWLAVNHVDTGAPDYPLVKVKYALLFALAPLLVAVFGLELSYFLNLSADVVTSCCSRVFSEQDKGLSGDLTALPLPGAMMAFWTSLVAAIAASSYAALKKRGGYLVAIASAAAFACAMAGIISFLSLYIYEHPNHHCPFCVLKADYAFQGYALYLPLFAATACGLSAGALRPFANVASLQEIIPRATGRLAAVSAVGFAVFAMVAAWMTLRSGLVLMAAYTHR